MLLDYCIGRAAVKVKEFYILPVGEKLMQYDTIAVNTIVKNKEGEVSSCDLSYNAELNQFNEEYLIQKEMVSVLPAHLFPVPSHADGRRSRRRIFEKLARWNQSSKVKNRRAFIEALRFLTFIEYDYPLE